MIEIDKKYKILIEVLCNAIKNRNLLKFYYESDSSKRKDWRIIKPYMIWPNSNNNLSLAGEPLDFRVNKKGEIVSGQYLLSQLLERFEKGQFEILSDKFESLKIPRSRVDDTDTEVICRFIYDDEDGKEAMKQWLKIKYV
jgi:hypothetical protein